MHGDVVAMARALLATEAAQRGPVLAQIFVEAELADLYRGRTGRAHPNLGTGSLMSAALARPVVPEPFLDDPEYAACLVQVLEALIVRAGGVPSRASGKR